MSGGSTGSSDVNQLVELQSLRGIAAIAVMVHHASYIFEMPVSYRLGVDLVLNAHAAIVVFFVLSGYVLTVSLFRRGLSAAALVGFYIRRLFRIYPALIVATLLGLLYVATLSGHPIVGISEWGDGRMEIARLSLFIISVSMVGWPYLLPPAYTIIIEMIGSALLPFMLMIISRGLYFSAALVIGLAGLSFIANAAGGRVVWLMFLIDFALGALLAVRAQGRTSARTKCATAVGVFCAIGLVTFRGGWMWVLTGSLQPQTFDYHNPVSALAEGLLSCGLIWSLANSSAFAWMENRWVAWLGDISYGIYLLHLPIAFFVAQGVAGLLGDTEFWLARTVAEVALTAAITVPCSAILYKFVERPGIELGRAWAKAGASQLMRLAPE